MTDPVFDSDPDLFTYAPPPSDQRHLIDVIGAIVFFILFIVLALASLVIVNTTIRRESTDHRANVNAKVQACLNTVHLQDMTLCLKAIQ